MGTKAKYSPGLRRKLKKCCGEAAFIWFLFSEKSTSLSPSRERHPPCFSPLTSQPPPNHPRSSTRAFGELLLLLQVGRRSGTGCGAINPRTFLHIFHCKKTSYLLSPWLSVSLAHLYGHGHLPLQQQVVSPLGCDLFGHRLPPTLECRESGDSRSSSSSELSISSSIPVILPASEGCIAWIRG